MGGFLEQHGGIQRDPELEVAEPCGGGELLGADNAVRKEVVQEGGSSEPGILGDGSEDGAAGAHNSHD